MEDQKAGWGPTWEFQEVHKSDYPFDAMGPPLDSDRGPILESNYGPWMDLGENFDELRGLECPQPVRLDSPPHDPLDQKLGNLGSLLVGSSQVQKEGLKRSQ